MKKITFSKINFKKILNAIPRGAAAAILSSALAALIIATLLPESADNFFLSALMIMCAVFSLLMELVRLPKAVNILIPSLCAAGGAAALLIPRGEERKSLLFMLINEKGAAAEEIILPCVCFCVVLCALVCTVNRSFVLRCITAGGTAVSFIMLIMMKMSLMPIIMILLLAYTLIVVCQVFAPKSREEGKKRQEPWYVFICAAAVVIAVMLPMPETRIPWEKLIHLNNTDGLVQLGEVLDIDKLEEEPEPENKTGYDEDVSSMGGWIEVSEGLPVEVSFSDGAFADRLTGSIYDSYTGKGWLSTISLTDTGYMSAADNASSSENNILDTDGYSRATVRKISTVGETVFSPPYTVAVTTKEGIGTERSGSRLVFSKPRSGRYTVYFADSLPDCLITDDERKAYLALPDTLPPRVADFAHSVTDGISGDAAKADALMKALSRYKYETKVSSVPKKSDFVDYFLFSSREGYCEYFASAMAVLARCEGIPSRFVIGYAVPNSKEEIVRISNANAHAWAELYIEDSGWVIYDPAAENAAVYAENAAAEEKEEQKDDGIFNKENMAALRKTLLYAYAAIAGFVVLFFIFRPFVIRIIKNIQLAGKYRKKAGYKTLRRCSRLLWTLSACGIRRIQSETADEFGERVTSQFTWLSASASEKLKKLLEQTGRILYSAEEFNEKGVLGAARAVRRSYIGKYGIFRYIRGWWRADI